MQLLLFLCLGFSQTWGLRLHSYFTPGMMMQRDMVTKVWGYDLVGWMDTGLTCQVEGEIVTHKLQTVRSMDGVWEAELPPQAAATICDFQTDSN